MWTRTTNQKSVSEASNENLKKKGKKEKKIKEKDRMCQKNDYRQESNDLDQNNEVVSCKAQNENQKWKK